MELDIKTEIDSQLPSPVVMPADLEAELKTRGRDPSRVSLYRCFEMEFKDRPWQVEQWTETEPGQTWPDDLIRARWIACWYNPGEKFFDFLLTQVENAGVDELTGLALNSSPRVPELLKRAKTNEVLSVLPRLEEKHRDALKSWLEDVATNGDASQVARARSCLKRWSK